MKVLIQGREQRGWSTECICSGAGNGMGGCGAKLLVEYGDLYMTYMTDYTGGRDAFVTFTCPCCGVETDIANVPSQIRSTIPDKSRRSSNSGL